MSKKLIVIIAIVLVLVVVAGVGWTYHEQPRFCADMCHIMGPYLESWNGSDYGAAAHAAEGVDCLGCHVPTIQEQVNELVVYVKGDYTIPLEELEVSDEFCYDCHLLDEHENKEQVVQRTEELERNPHDSHLIGEMACSTCHKMHKPSEDQCAVCHDDVATGAGWTTEVTRTAEIQVWDPAMDCTACKSMVAYVDSLEDANLMGNAHAEEGLVCLDCHEQEATKQVHEAAVPGRVKARKVNNEFCFDCHLDNQHTSYEEVIERTKDYTVDEEQVNPHAPHEGLEAVAELQCSDCHQMHEESPLINYCYSCHHLGALASCSTCHE